jgi:hypothetical protein
MKASDRETLSATIKAMGYIEQEFRAPPACIVPGGAGPMEVISPEGTITRRETVTIVMYRDEVLDVKARE